MSMYIKYFTIKKFDQMIHGLNLHIFIKKKKNTSVHATKCILSIIFMIIKHIIYRFYVQRLVIKICGWYRWYRVMSGLEYFSVSYLLDKNIAWVENFKPRSSIQSLTFLMWTRAALILDPFSILQISNHN